MEYPKMKHLLKACIALAAFMAFAVVPAVASAENDATLQQPTGTALAPTHTTTIPVVGTNVGKTEMLSSGGAVLVSCDTAEMTGDLETNTHTAVEGTITSASFKNHASTECSGSFGNVTVTTSGFTNSLPWCLRSTSTMKTDEFQVRGNSCTSPSRSIRFILHSTTVGECEYERTAAIVGTYKTHPTAAELSIANQEFKLIRGGFFCPPAGFLKMTFSLYRETAGVHINDPIYIVNAT
jgi:hypothetical protein